MVLGLGAVNGVVEHCSRRDGRVRHYASKSQLSGYLLTRGCLTAVHDIAMLRETVGTHAVCFASRYELLNLFTYNRQNTLCIGIVFFTHYTRKLVYLTATSP